MYGSHLLQLLTVQHFLFARTLFSRKFARASRRKNIVLTDNVRSIDYYSKNRENKFSWRKAGIWSRENKVTRIVSVLQYFNSYCTQWSIINLNVLYKKNRKRKKRMKGIKTFYLRDTTPFICYLPFRNLNMFQVNLITCDYGKYKILS